MRRVVAGSQAVALAAVLSLWAGPVRAGGASVIITAPTVAEYVTEGGKQREYQRLRPGEALEITASGPFLLMVKVRALAGASGSGELGLRVTLNGASSAEKRFALDGTKGDRYTERDKFYIEVPAGVQRYRLEATRGEGAVRLARSKKTSNDTAVASRLIVLEGGAAGSEVITAVTAPASTAALSPGRRVVVAVAPFKNFSLDPQFEGYANAVPAQLVSVLGRSARVQVVEREALDQALGEVALAQRGIVDPSTAQQLGQVLGAEYLIAGGVAVFDGAIRVDARLINVSTGQAIGKSAGAPRGSELNRAVEDLGAKLVEQITGEVLFPERYAKKSPWAAGLFSVFPGGGQYYNERYVKGAVITGLGAASVASVLVTHKAHKDAYNAYKDSHGTKSRRDDLFDRAENILLVRNLLIGVAAAVEVFSIYDAIAEAVQDNEDIDQRTAGLEGGRRLHLLPTASGVAVGFSTSF